MIWKYAATLGLIVLASLAYFSYEPDGMKSGHGPFPSDWFMQQRTWPDSHIEQSDYLRASEQAARLGQVTLDDQPEWVSVGPTNIGGRVTDIVGHPTDLQTFYVAAASGGVFKTVNGGSTWTSIFDSAPTLSIGALAMDPDNSNVIYVGTGEANSAGYSYFGNGLYRTIDAGANWTHLGLAPTQYIARVVVDPTNSQTLWVAAMGELFIESQDRGVYRSIDGGNNWERVLFVNDSTGASDVVVNPQNPQLVYAAMWERIRGPEERRVGGRGSGIFRSTDGGGTWTRLTSGLPAQEDNVGRIGLSLCYSSPGVLYAIYADDPGNFAGVYKSVDGGESWGRVNDGMLGNMYSNFGWYFGNIRVRPDNPNHVFALGQTLWRSTDGGMDWNEIAWEVHVDHHAMWFAPDQPNRIIIGNDGGVYGSINNGNSWVFVSGLPINQFYAATVDFQLPQRRYGGTQDNGTLRTLTGGADDWGEIHGGDGFYVIVSATNSNRIWAEYQWGGLRRSNNGGNNWQSVTDGIDDDERRNWSTPVVASPANPEILYYGAERLYKTTNGGDSWSAISPDLTDGGGSGNLTFGTITTIGVSSLNSQLIYVGTDDANVKVTTSGGQSWSDRSDGLPNRWITRVTPDPFEQSVAYVTVSGYRNAEQVAHIFRSENYGRNWRNVSGELPDGPLNDIEIDPLIHGRIYCASDFGAFVSPDYGEHWLPLGEELPRVPVIDLVLHAPTRELVAATYGRSMLTLNLNELELNRAPWFTSFAPAQLDSLATPSTLEFTIVAIDPDTEVVSIEWTRNGEVVGTGSSVQLEFSVAAVEHVEAIATDGELIARKTWDFIAFSGTPARDPLTSPVSHELLSVYPNPFNSRTEIRYELSQLTDMELRIRDVTGREVAILHSGPTASQHGTISLSADGLASGMYFLELETPSDRALTKLLLLK